MVLTLRPGMRMDRQQMLLRLNAMSYERNDIDFKRDKVRVNGETVDIFPASSGEHAIRVEFFGDEIDRVCEIDPVTRSVTQVLKNVTIFPATHYAVSSDKREAALAEIEDEMRQRVKYFEKEDKLIEAQRIEERTLYDIEMLREVGFCHGVENYSRVLSGRAPGSTPFTLLDYFPEDFLLFVDESHVTLPQVRGMSGGDYARKKNLVDFGFRLPSAFDNRPLFFDEFESKLNQVVYVSATPGDYEKNRSEQRVEQIIRPTGLLDPEPEVRGTEGQIDDLIGEIRARVEKHERVLVTTLTKKMAEDLSEYLEMQAIKVKYIHHNIDTMERMEIIRDLRAGACDVLVGINLLREGLDLPEVSLVAILDADKEGFLRSESALIQTIGRAARHVNGKVILYADSVTPSMKAAIDETKRRRRIQSAYNAENGIVPKSISKKIADVISIGEVSEEHRRRKGQKSAAAAPKNESIELLTSEMLKAAKELRFEEAAYLRDRIAKLKKEKEKV